MDTTQGTRPAQGRAGPAAAAAALATMAAMTACTAQPGPALHDVAPGLDARIGKERGTVERAVAQPWDVPSAAWDGRVPLTAEAALRCALANNRTLRRTLAEVDRRRAMAQDLQLPPNPTLDVAVGAPLSMGVVPVLAMVSAQVDWLWRRDAIVGEADAQLRTLVLESAAVIAGTATEVRAAYVDAAAATELAALARADADVAARVLRSDEDGFRAGEVRATVVNQARMNAAEAQNRVIEAESAQLAARTRLLEAIGRGDASPDFPMADSTAAAARAACGIEPPPVPEDDAALHALVRDRRIDLRAADARVGGIEARLSLARTAGVPSLLLGGGYQRDMTDDDGVMVQVQSTIPLLNDGRYKVAQAQAELEVARIEADRLWQRAVIDARRALSAVAAADHHAATLRDATLPAFDANRRALAEGVRAGERPAVELWRSEHQENHVRIQVARAERDRALAALAFERALTGTRLPSIAGGGMQPAAASAGMGGAMGAGTAVPDFEFTALETME
jgi:outer membrane protein TolC